jgi:hypothetical protein
LCVTFDEGFLNIDVAEDGTLQISFSGNTGTRVAVSGPQVNNLAGQEGATITIAGLAVTPSPWPPHGARAVP